MNSAYEHGRNLCAICGGATLTQISRKVTRLRSEKVVAIDGSLVCLHWHREAGLHENVHSTCLRPRSEAPFDLEAVSPREAIGALRP